NSGKCGNCHSSLVNCHLLLVIHRLLPQTTNHRSPIPYLLRCPPPWLHVSAVQLPRLIFQNFHPFLEENEPDWKIWKIYMRFSRGKRLFSNGKSFSRAIGKYKPRVFPSEVDLSPTPPLENMEIMARQKSQ